MYNLPEECLIRDKKGNVIGIKEKCKVQKIRKPSGGGGIYNMPTEGGLRMPMRTNIIPTLSSFSTGSLLSSLVTDTSSTVRRGSISSLSSSDLGYSLSYTSYPSTAPSESGSLLSDLPETPRITTPPRQVSIPIVERVYERIKPPAIKIPLKPQSKAMSAIQLSDGGIGVTEVPKEEKREIPKEEKREIPLRSYAIEIAPGGVKVTDVERLVDIGDIVVEDIEHEEH